MLDNKELVMGRKGLKQFLINVQTNDHHKETILTKIANKKDVRAKEVVQNLDLQKLT